MQHTSAENIADALKLLEEAAKQKKDELKTLISDKYTNLTNLIMEGESSLVKSLTDAKESAIEAAIHARDVSVKKAREIARDADKSVHHNPWPYIAGSAAVGLLVGFFLDRNRK